MNNQKQINAFDSSIASLQGLAELILITLPVSKEREEFEYFVYEALAYLSDAQKSLKQFEYKGGL